MTGMWFIIAGLCFGVACGTIAQQRGRAFLEWFVIGAVTGIFGLGFLLYRTRDRYV
ncbi:MAG: hypothetical protein QOE23_2224 [Pseudonocardiales bacterium]|nr:hypothetical protein [Pseudonocardiales bacterium]